VSERLARAIEAAMREHRLEEWHRETVLGLLEEPPERWAACCGNACDPCVLVLARVVARVHALLATPE
jgi:hypothetical protein